MTGWVCGYVMEFTEGDPERRIVYTGTLANCERLAARLDEPMRGIAYEGDRTPTGALVFVCEAAGARDAVNAQVVE